MSSPSARPLLRAVAVTCLLAGTAGVAAAHPIVLLEDRSLSVDSGGSVEIPLRFHDADRATLTVTGEDGVELEATVVDPDRDGAVRITLDAAAAGAGNATGSLSASGGAVRNATVRGSSGGGLNRGEYTVTVAPPNGGRDEGTLRVASGESTATPTGTESTAGPPDGPTTTDPTATPTATPPSAGLGLPWPPSLLLALFGPAVPVIALVGASRLGGE